MGESEGQGRRDGHLVVYVGWPVLSGLALATVAAVSVGGVVLIAGGGEWREAGTVAAVVWFVALGLVTVGVFWYAASEWRGPRQRERIELTRHAGDEGPGDEGPWDAAGEEECEAPWRVLRPYGAQRGRPLLAAPDMAVRSLFPEVDAQTQALYEFITRVWPTGNVSRDHCIALGFGRAQWERYVGGQRGKEGLETGRGILERAGLVYRDEKGYWNITPGATLEAAYRVTEGVEQYAGAMARLVRVGQDG